VKIADLYLKLGLSGGNDVSKGLTKISGSLQELFSMSIKTKLTLAGIAAGLTGAAFSAGKTGATLSAFKNTFDLSTDTLQRWQQGAEAFGVSGDEMIGTIGGIQNALADAMTHGGVSEVFTKLAIDPRKFRDAYSVIEELRKRIQGGQIDVMRLFSSGLISQNVFQMLRQIGDPTQSKLVRPLLTEKDIKAAQAVSVSFTRFQENLKRSMDKFIVDNSKTIMEFMKAVQDGILWFMKLIKENQPLINDLVNALKDIAGILKNALGLFPKTLSVVTDATKEAAASGHGAAASIGLGLNAPFAKLGQWMIDSSLGKILPIGKEVQKPSVMPNAPENRGPGWTEFQDSKSQSTFIMNGVSLDGKVSPSWEKETAAVYRQIATRGTA
jgi:hypothetical protein